MLSSPASTYGLDVATHFVFSLKKKVSLAEFDQVSIACKDVPKNSVIRFKMSNKKANFALTLYSFHSSQAKQNRAKLKIHSLLLCADIPLQQAILFA